MGPNKSWNAECNPSLSIIEALQIEGHTDSDGTSDSNLNLSTARANSTFTKMTASKPGLVDFQNFRNQPVLSVAGYGQMRPIRTNDTPEGKATNRRVDLRIIMYSPSRSDEIERIRNSLEKSDGVANGNPEKLKARGRFEAPALPAINRLWSATERIQQRWPDVVANPPERDRERLVAEINRRFQSDDWNNTPMSLVTSASRALFDAERRERPDLVDLRRFYFDECRVSTRMGFLGAMASIYIGSYVPSAHHTREFSDALREHVVVWADAGRNCWSISPKYLIHSLRMRPSRKRCSR